MLYPAEMWDYQEEGLLGEELPKYAATGPDIYSRAVALLTQQQLRGPVPQGDHLQREHAAHSINQSQKNTNKQLIQSINHKKYQHTANSINQ